jgi:hypothetical protein
MPETRPSLPTAVRALAALRRSAARARRVATQTKTRIVVVRNGQLVIEPVENPPHKNTTERENTSEV